MTEDLKEEKIQKVQKFLFDQNNFNDDYVEEPPEPTFSSEELEQARLQGVEQAAKLPLWPKTRNQALLELTGDMLRLFAFLEKEDERARAYEEETLKLVMKSLESYPEYEQQHGMSELQSILKQALTEQKIESDIKIEVSSEVIDDIKSYFEDKVQPQIQTSAKISVVVREGFGFSDCLISWDDGGAKRDASAQRISYRNYKSLCRYRSSKR